jgi:hypothetical protein
MIHDDSTKGVLGLALIGAVVGLGKLLASDETLTKRVVAGRALSSGALGMAAAAILSFMPDIPFTAQMGIAALLSSLGTSALERIIQRIAGGS